jgi:hypothetical protein
MEIEKGNIYARHLTSLNVFLYTKSPLDLQNTPSSNRILRCVLPAALQTNRPDKIKSTQQTTNSEANKKVKITCPTSKHLQVPAIALSCIVI